MNMESDQSTEVEKVVVSQPRMDDSSGFAPPGLPSSGGLQALIPLDKVFIHQKIKIFTLTYRPNKYVAVDQNQQLVYNVNEEPYDLCGRLCLLGSDRSFVMSFTDAAGHEAIRLERQLLWCESNVCVYTGSSLLGTVQQSVWTCVPKFCIVDPYGQRMYNIVGNMCAGGGFSPEFMVCTPDGHEIGLIKKQWAGFLRELTTDIFGVSFPVDLDVRHKALLLGAAIHIDFAFFEKH